MENLDLVTSIVIYDSKLISESELIQINDTIQYSEFTINLLKNSKWGDNPFPENDYWRNANIFTEYFCGDFFVLVQNTTNNMPIGTGSGAVFGPSSNFTSGIGISIHDTGFPFRGVYTSHWTRAMHTILSHELLHKWAAPQDLYGNSADGLGITNFGHWAWIQMSSSGLLGPTSFEFSDYTVLGGDTLEIIRNYRLDGSPIWNNLELYMAGLMPIDSVDFPLTYLINVVPLSNQGFSPVTVTANIETLTKEDWLASVGQRIPEQGPTDYSMVQIVYSDAFLTSGQMSYFDEAVRKAMLAENPNRLTIYEATKGLVSVSNAITRIETEIVYNNIDDDCDPNTLDDDLDQDGYLLVDDCDDMNPNINPGLKKFLVTELMKIAMEKI